MDDDEFFYFRDGLDNITTALLENLNSTGITAEDIHQFVPWKPGFPIPTRMLLTISPRREAVTMTLERTEIEACGDLVSEDILQRIHVVVTEFQRSKGTTSVDDQPQVRLPEPCKLCVRTHEQQKFPAHLVVPVTYKKDPLEPEGEAGCPLCGALWRRIAARPELVT